MLRGLAPKITAGNVAARSFPKMIVCARCGAQNQPTNKFCLSCGAPVQQAPAAQGGQAPQQGGAYGAPPAGWGQQGSAQPQQHPPPGASPYGQPGQPGQPGQQPPPQGGWGGQPQQGQAPQGGYAPQAPGYGQAGAPYQFGSPEGLNPFGATVGPPQQQHYGSPQQGQPQQPQHGSPQHHGAHQGHAQPGQPQQGQWGQDRPYPATAPPPTADEYAAQPGGHAQPAGHAQHVGHAPAQAPPAQRGPSSPSQIAAGAQVPSSRPGRDPETVDANAPRALAGFLVSYEGNELGTFYPIHQGQNLVGRKGAASGLNIELEHGTTSSRHAMILASSRPGRVKIEDIGSTNGTFVGDLMLERGKKHELKDGDVVRFGGYVTIVKII